MRNMTEFGNSYTFRLFKKSQTSPFIEGMASILDMSGTETLYNYDKSDALADRNSICDDWKQVGEDLRQAMRQYAPRQTT